MLPVPSALGSIKHTQILDSAALHCTANPELAYVRSDRPPLRECQEYAHMALSSLFFTYYNDAGLAGLVLEHVGLLFVHGSCCTTEGGEGGFTASLPRLIYQHVVYVQGRTCSVEQQAGMKGNALFPASEK